MDRPTEFTTEIAAAICERLADGESLRSICRDESMPNKAMVFHWLGKNSAFADQYVRAREAQADALADEILDIADDGSNDWMQRRKRDGSIETVLDAEHVKRSQLRVDARKWIAAKMRPKKYGEKSSVELSAPGGGPLVPTAIGITFGKVAPGEPSDATNRTAPPETP